jgi:hypothetical protein
MTTLAKAEHNDHREARRNGNQASRLRICFVCSEYPPGPHGGIGTMTQVLGRALCRGGHQVKVVGMYPADYPAPDRAEDHGVEVIRLRQGSAKGDWVLARLRLFRHVARWARDGVIDLVEVPDWGGWAACWPRLPVPVVARLNGSVTYFAAEAGRTPNRLTRWLERRSLERAQVVCAASRYTSLEAW